MKKIKYGIVAFALLLMTNVSFAQDQNTEKFTQYATTIVQKLNAETALTEKQTDEMMEITFGYTLKIEEIKKDPVLNKTQRDALLAEYVSMREGVIQRVLTAEQYAKYTKIVEKNKFQ